MPNDAPSASEVRIRREIRAMVWPLVGVALYGLSFQVDHGAVIGVLAAVAFIAWLTTRPELPGDEAQQLARWAFHHPRTMTYVVISGAGLGVGIPAVSYEPSQSWAWFVLGGGIGATAVLAFVIVVGRRKYDRERQAAQT